jgi:hypothetical protein
LGAQYHCCLGSHVLQSISFGALFPAWLSRLIERLRGVRGNVADHTRAAAEHRPTPDHITAPGSGQASAALCDNESR